MELMYYGWIWCFLSLNMSRISLNLAGTPMCACPLWTHLHSSPSPPPPARKKFCMKPCCVGSHFTRKGLETLQQAPSSICPPDIIAHEEIYTLEATQYQRWRRRNVRSDNSFATIWEIAWGHLQLNMTFQHYTRVLLCAGKKKPFAWTNAIFANIFAGDYLHLQLLRIRKYL